MASYSRAQYNPNVKNLWCRGAYVDSLVERLGFNPFVSDKQPFKKCVYSKEKCRGGHSIDQIKLFPAIKKYIETDYSKCNWIELYDLILAVMRRDVPKILLKECQELAKNFESMNFIKLAQTWRELAIIHRKLKKEENIKPYTLQNIPIFTADDKDEFLWSFVKATKFCESHQMLNSIIAQKKTMSVWDICLATGINCRAGGHENNEMMCVPNFLTGICDCITKEKFELAKKDIIENIEKLEIEIKTVLSEEKSEWVQVKSKKNNIYLTGLKMRLSQHQKQYDDLIISRLIHYTESGMVPFDIQFKEYQKKHEKAGWDRDISQVVQVKPVIKIGKLKKN